MPVTFWECPWQILECRKCPWHLPVTFLPVTFPKRPWQFSKKCPWHRKNGRDKFQKSNVTPIKKCNGEKKNWIGYHHFRQENKCQKKLPKTRLVFAKFYNASPLLFFTKKKLKLKKKPNFPEFAKNDVTPPPSKSAPLLRAKHTNFRVFQNYPTTVDFLKCSINSPLVKDPRFSKGVCVFTSNRTILKKHIPWKCI